jgi:hypothetical protein
VASVDVSDDEHPARVTNAIALMENVRTRERMVSYFLLGETV